MATLHRRDVLKLGLAATAAALVPQVSRPARAVGAPRKLVVVLASGGWDTTYALDPKPGSTVIDVPEGTLETLGGIPVLTHTARPSVRAFFERWANRCTVINGVQVRSFVHSDCVKRIMTGTPSDQRPDVGAIVASELGSELPVPYLVLGNSALSGPLASLTARAGTTNQLSALLSPDPATSWLAPGFVPSDGERALAAEWLRGSTDGLRATRGRLGSNARELEAFLRALDRQGLLRAFARDHGGFGEREYTPDLGVQVSVALDALQSGLCQSVMLELGDWDTHQNNARQTEKWEALFTGLVALNEGLEARQLFESTLVLVISEMGRTPKLNASQGKDHWPVTSAIAYGAGVAGGRVLGGTDDLLGALPVDFATGAVAEGAVQIQTGNLLAAVLELAGVDPTSHLPGSEPLHAIAG
jgi:uncharacterized protein (DUF1501 family)